MNWICKKCGSEQTGAYCSVCGRKKTANTEWQEVKNRAADFSKEMYGQEKEGENPSLAKEAWGLAKYLCLMKYGHLTGRYWAAPGAADLIEQEARLIYPLLRDHFRARLEDKVS